MSTAESSSPSKVPSSRKELQGTLMALEQANGVSIAALARKYAITPGAVRARIDSVRESGIFEAYRFMLGDALVPMALAVYEARLQRGDFEAARDVLFGLGILTKNTKGPEPARPSSETETLEIYRRTRASAAERPLPTVYIEAIPDAEVE